jgi:hypothetical protein
MEEDTKVHCFERAGLGKAPFRVIGFEVRKYQACPGAPVQPGASCDYCGTGIMNVFHIKGAGSEAAAFKVGCDCVAKTGDGGLRKAVNGLIREYRAEKRNAEWKALAATRKAARDAERAAERAACLAAHPGLEAALKVENDVIKDIGDKLDAYGSISPKQAALVLSLAARATEKHAKAPTGRLVVRGVLVSKKSYENDYGVSIKGTVKIDTPDGNWLAWGTLPASLLLAGYEGSARAEIGDVIEFTATLKPGRDAYFALWSRPTKGRIVERAARAEDAAEVA